MYLIAKVPMLMFLDVNRSQLILYKEDQPHLTFPVLKIKETAVEETVELKIYQDSLEIIYKFREVFLTTVKSLLQRVISLTDIVFRSTSPSEGPTLKGLLPNLRDVEDTGKIMQEVFSCSSFFNFHLLEQIVDQVGTENDKENFIRYKEQFYEYAERDLSICPAELGKMKEEHFANLFVTLDKVHQQCTLNSLQSFSCNLREILNISDVELQLCCTFATNPVGLIFQIPLYTHKSTFPLTNDQCEAIIKLGVLQLSCGSECIDQNEDKVRSIFEYARLIV